MVKKQDFGFLSSMARKFDIPLFYRSPIISRVKEARRHQDRYRKDISPSILDLGRIRFKLGRHFGFCYGVENAIEIAYRALRENPDKRVFLLSEMIHNPHVNQDLMERGIRFLMKTNGEWLIPLEQLKSDDVVIVPAFGTTVELFRTLEKLGIDARVYNTTCPFVEKVWNRAATLGEQGYTIIIHGRHNHEETRATFSHASLSAPCLIIRDLAEAHILAEYISSKRPLAEFDSHFAGRYSPDFIPAEHLQRIGVVNQTTMLATETQEISDHLRGTIQKMYPAEQLNHHFADTRDTLCYATSENQDATYGLIRAGGDLSVVVGGYNSSNTSHLVELLEQHAPTFYIKDAQEIISASEIRHLDMHSGQVITTLNWLPIDRIIERPVDILITAGASCPDALVDEVISRIATLVGLNGEMEPALERVSTDMSVGGELEGADHPA